MIISRVLPTLVKLNRVINLSTFTKARSLNSASVSRLKLFPEIRAMSTNVDEELNDPKRHFDYNQFIERKDKSGVVVIDVRDDSEIKETGKIPGSIHIPLKDLHFALDALSDMEFLNEYKFRKPKFDDEIIFTCRSGRRMAQLGKALGEMSAEEFKKQYNADKPEKDNEVIFSCLAGGRSFKAMKLSLELGYSKAGNYKGGWRDWAEKTAQSKK